MGRNKYPEGMVLSHGKLSKIIKKLKKMNVECRDCQNSRWDTYQEFILRKWKTRRKIPTIKGCELGSSQFISMKMLDCGKTVGSIMKLIVELLTILNFRAISLNIILKRRKHYYLFTYLWISL